MPRVNGAGRARPWRYLRPRRAGGSRSRRRSGASARAAPTRGLTPLAWRSESRARRRGTVAAEKEEAVARHPDSRRHPLTAVSGRMSTEAVCGRTPVIRCKAARVIHAAASDLCGLVTFDDLLPGSAVASGMQQGYPRVEIRELVIVSNKRVAATRASERPSHPQRVAANGTLSLARQPHPVVSVRLCRASLQFPSSLPAHSQA